MVKSFGEVREATAGNGDGNRGRSLQTREIFFRGAPQRERQLFKYSVWLPDFLLTLGPVDDPDMEIEDAIVILDIAEALVKQRLRRTNWGKHAKYSFSMLGGLKDFEIVDEEGVLFVGGGMTAFEVESREDLPRKDLMESIVQDELSNSLAGSLQEKVPSVTTTSFTTLTSSPTTSPTEIPTLSPTVAPTEELSSSPTLLPTFEPTTTAPSETPILPPTGPPTTMEQTNPPTLPPSMPPPTRQPTRRPAPYPTSPPQTVTPSTVPSKSLAETPTAPPSKVPSAQPTTSPVTSATMSPVTPQPTTAKFAEVNREVDYKGSEESAIEIPAVAGSATVAVAVMALIAVILVVRKRRRKEWRHGTNHNAPTEENGDQPYVAKGNVAVDASSDAGSSRLGRIMSALDAVVNTRGITSASDMDHSHTTSDADTEDFTDAFENVEEVEPKIVFPVGDPEEAPSPFNKIEVIEPNMVSIGDTEEEFPPDFDNVEEVAPTIVPISDTQSFELHASLHDFDGFCEFSSSNGEYVKAGEFLLNASWDDAGEGEEDSQAN